MNINEVTRLFSRRFILNGPKYNIQLKNLRSPNYNKELNAEFLKNKTKSNYSTSLVFHKIRDSFDNEKILKSISDCGFFVKSDCGNKGYGLYCSSHSNYPLLWGDGTTIICEIINDPKFIKAHISEIPPGQEYRILNRNFIRPIMLVDAQVFINRGIKFKVYYEHGFSGCKICDALKKRCDCEKNIEIFI